MMRAPEFAPRRHFVVLLGNGEDAEDKKRCQDDFVAEGVHGRDGQAGMRKEDAGRAPGSAREVRGPVEMVDHRHVQHIYEIAPAKPPNT